MDREKSRGVVSVVCGVCLIGLALVAAGVAGYAMALAYPRAFAAAAWVLLAGVLIGLAQEMIARFYVWRLWRRVNRRINREVQADMDRRAARRGVPS
jgi:uncharacterized membrane protein